MRIPRLFMYSSNMSLTHALWINFRRMLFMKDYLAAMLLYRTRFKNYLSVLMNLKQNKFPLTVILKSNEKKLVSNRKELTPLLYDVEYDHENDILSLDNLGYPVKLYSAIENGELVPIFKNRDYDFLKVKGKTVIDIGANIADSSIYFALEGAVHVIALEPYPKNYQIAKKNIDLNNLNSRITLLNAGGGSIDKNIFINSEYAGICKPLEASSSGLEVSVISLNTLVSKFSVNSGSLKMDCEGCEYDMILNTSIDILSKFSRIQIEYHYGYKDLSKKLEECGFEVKVTNPIHIQNELAKESNMYVGYIYASKNLNL